MFDVFTDVETGLKSLRINSARAKWRNRQLEDPKNSKVIDFMTEDKLMKYKVGPDDSENMKIYLKVRKEHFLQVFSSQVGYHRSLPRVFVWGNV